MGKELRRLSQRKKVLEKIDKLFESAEDVIVVHYSCESFYDIKDGRTPRVTSIAVRNLESGQTESFSIHKIAEQTQTLFEDIDVQYDTLEKEMLKEYFSFLHLNQSKTWVHWNMRDVNYGFQAIEHRYKALGGEPIALPENKKFDFPRGLITIYGIQYISHPRLENLIEKNHVSHRSFLNGKEEAYAFESKEYVKLHQSTLRKVDIFAKLLERTANRSLKTDAKWHQIYGIHPKVIIELLRSHWIFSLIGLIVMIGGLLRLTGFL